MQADAAGELRRAKRAKSREALLLLFTALLATTVGFQLKTLPPGPITFSQYLVVAAPLKISSQDGEETHNLKILDWAESRGPGLEVAYGSDSLFPPILPDNDTTRVQISFLYDGTVMKDMQFDAQVAIPENAQFAGCWLASSQPPDHSVCEPVPNPDMDRGSQHSSRTIKISTKVKPYSTAVSAFFDLKNINGMAFASNDKFARIRFPILDPSPYSDVSDGQPNVLVDTGVVFRSSSGIRWGQNPMAGMSALSAEAVGAKQRPNIAQEDAAWRYTYSDTQSNPPPDIIGVKESRETADATHDFYSGIAFGTAGAAAIGGLQAFVAWLPMKVPRRRRLRFRSKAPYDPAHAP